MIHRCVNMYHNIEIRLKIGIFDDYYSGTPFNHYLQICKNMHIGEFSFEIAKVNSKCDFVSPIVFSAKRKGEMRRGEYKLVHLQ